MRAYVHAHMHTYVHTCLHTYIHTYVCTCIRTPSSPVALIHAPIWSVSLAAHAGLTLSQSKGAVLESRVARTLYFDNHMRHCMMQLLITELHHSTHQSVA